MTREKKEQLKRELASQVAARILQDVDYSMSPWAVSEASKLEVLNDAIRMRLITVRQAGKILGLGY